MAEKTSENTTQKGKNTFSNIMKVLGSLAIFIPLMTGIFQYRVSIHQKLDENFRSIAEELYSKDSEKRVAAASKMSTFLSKGIFKNEYYYETIDILINRLSIEVDYHVVNAIIGSLKRIDDIKDFKEIIKKLLDRNRNLSIQKEVGVRDVGRLFSSNIVELSKTKGWLREKRMPVSHPNLIKETSNETSNYLESMKDYNALEIHRQVVTDAIITLLSSTKIDQKSFPTSFLYNNLNSTTIRGLNFENVNIRGSSLRATFIEETKFNHSVIENTDFTFSELADSDFVECSIKWSLFDHVDLKNVTFSKTKFTDVFFKDSDLTGVRFVGTEGLKAVYFYKAKNIDKAKFVDNVDKDRILEELKKITDDKFEKYVRNESTLTNHMQNELLKVADTN